MTIDTEQDDVLAMLSDSLARYVADHYRFEQRLALLADGRPQAAQAAPLWRGLGEDLDLLRTALPEAQGGLGLGMRAHMALLPVLGGALAAQPYVSSLVMSGGALQRAQSPLATRLLDDMVRGRGVVAFAHAEPGLRHDPDTAQTTLSHAQDGWVLNGTKSVVQCAPWASHLLVTARSGAGLSLVVVPVNAEGVQMRVYRTRDGDGAADVALRNVRVPVDHLLGHEGSAGPAIAQVLDEGTLAICAESIGVMRCLMRDTLDYVRQRQQFGVPIGSFQVLQHRLADLHMALEMAAALTQTVGETVDGLTPAERARAVSSAKVAVSKACRAVGQGAVQLHGGMGMTEELAVGHYMRRATLIENQFGAAAWHVRRVAHVTQAGANIV